MCLSSPSASLVLLEQHTQWGKGCWHVGQKLAIITEKPKKQLKLSHILRLWGVLNGYILISCGINAIWVDLVTKVLYLLYHKQALRLLQLGTSCLQSFRNCHQGLQMFLLSLSCDQDVVHAQLCEVSLWSSHQLLTEKFLEQTALFSSGSYRYACWRSNFEKTFPPASIAKSSSTLGRGYESSEKPDLPSHGTHHICAQNHLSWQPGRCVQLIRMTVWVQLFQYLISMEETLQKYDVLDDRLGEVKGMDARIDVDPQAQPCFVKPAQSRFP